MKKLLYFLFIPLSFTACKKETEAEPDAATKVSGTYQLSYISNETGSQKTETPLPVVLGGQTVASGTVAVTRKSANFVDGVLLFKSAGSSDVTLPLANVEVKNSSSPYDLYLGTTKIGTSDGTDLSVDITQPASGTTQAIRITFKGKKQ